MIENQGQTGQKIVTIYDDIYDLPDCRDYYRAMDHAGFRTAHHATTAFRSAAADLKRLRGLSDLTVVDFASGYGIASALMRHTHSLDDVLARYRDPSLAGLSPEAVIKADRDWFSGAKRADDQNRYYGIDIAGNALDYGVGAGVFEKAFAENLQDDAPSSRLAEVLAETDLIVECGSVAHMLPAALDAMLKASTKSPWIIMSPIRGNDTAEAIEVMESHGLVVDFQSATPFPHRRFSTEDEQARAIVNAQARGYDTDGFESTGSFHAQIFLARPAADVDALKG